jgi:hypothetical protein
VIPQDVLDAIKQRVSLVRIAQDAGVTLRANGNGTLVGLCPFHPEKTPSFTVFVQKQPQDFHCFGCAAHGEVIAFVMKVRGLDFLDAVRFLADRAGISLPADGAPVAPPDPAAFAADRGLRVETLTHFGVQAIIHQHRPALRYPTPLRIERVKFTDGSKPKYKWFKPGGRAHWYGLDDALALLLTFLAKPAAIRLYIVNGEPSVWACYEARVPAVCLAGGEGTVPNGELVAELATWLGALDRPIQVAVVYDADGAGGTGAPKVGTALKAVVSDVVMLDIASVMPNVPGADVGDLYKQVGNKLADVLAALPVLVADTKQENTTAPGSNTAQRGVWDATTAADFVAEVDPELDWLEQRLLAQGSITEWFAPRGLGKTQVAMALAVKLASVGHRVLYLDRDNSRREVRRRLRAWGAGSLTTLKVKTRDDVPPLTDRTTWKLFPFRDYDLVIIDSLDASTEGVGEQDSGKSSKAIAPLLDIAHRADGPAILVLGNTIKSGTHGRGSGIIEDRADISYEVRDATNFHPSGTKPWWEELPAAGRDVWAERASRRKHRDTYRLAFVPSKFRVGEEPAPFILEIDLSTDPWSYRDVTERIEADAEAAHASEAERKVKAQAQALDRLATEVNRRAAAGEPPLNLSGAVKMLVAGGVPRDPSRTLLNREAGTRWRLVKDDAQLGHPILVVGVKQEWPPEKDLPLGKACQSGVSDDAPSSGSNVHGSEAGSPNGNPCQSGKSDADGASDQETIPPEKEGGAGTVEPQGLPEDSSFSGGPPALPAAAESASTNLTLSPESEEATDAAGVEYEEGEV